MNEQPEALRLAEQLETFNPNTFQCAAAAELRRLYAELQQWKSVFGHLGTADECGNEWIKVMEQRDELLEALRWIDRRCPAVFLLQDLHRVHMEAAFDAGVCARAAIAKATGEQT